MIYYNINIRFDTIPAYDGHPASNLSTAKTALMHCIVWVKIEHISELNGSMKELNKFHNYETEKIIRKARKPAIIAGRTTRYNCSFSATSLALSGGITEQHVIIIITCCLVVLPERITRKASDPAEDLQL